MTSISFRALAPPKKSMEESDLDAFERLPSRRQASPLNANALQSVPLSIGINLRHMWTAPISKRFYVLIPLVGCGHMSGL